MRDGHPLLLKDSCVSCDVYFNSAWGGCLVDRFLIKVDILSLRFIKKRSF